VTAVEPGLTEAAYLGYFESCSNWHRWGDDDERGTLNLITPDHAAAAARLVRDGVPVSAERPLRGDYSAENPRPLLRFMIASGEAAPERGQYESSDWFGIAPHGHSVTHLDSLGHSFFDGRCYNGRPADVVATKTGVGTGSVEAAASGIVTRGVLLDVPRALGLAALPLGTAITPDDLMRCERAQGITVRTGDALLVRTGRDVPQGSDFGEVQTGFARTGEMFAVDVYGVRPDILVLGKGIASGFPMSAIGSSAAVMSAWAPGARGGTYGGNPMGCAAALETIAILTEPGFAEAVRARSGQLLAGARALAARHGFVTDVRGLGLMLGIEFDTAERAGAFAAHCLAEDSVIVMGAASGRVIRCMPPLTVSAAEVDLALASFDRAAAATEPLHA
jgi:hypothetical protein